jgi:hypothetical protein
MLLRPAPVSTARFTRTDLREYVAEASDLGRNPFGRVYDDACDIGLTLVHERTGRQLVLYVHDEHRDAEGELQWWELRPVPRRDQPGMLPGAEDTRVRVYND